MLLSFVSASSLMGAPVGGAPRLDQTRGSIPAACGRLRRHTTRVLHQ